tara:strand:- start:1015 stop:2451 length:1437 start_codon:yes stop_codon:yes gene_type:complete
MKSEALKYIPVNLANIFISFGTITILTRLLSAAEFGRYALVITTLNFIHMGFFTWLEASMSRFHERADKTDSLDSHFKTLYYSAAAVLTLLIPLLSFAVFALEVDSRMRLLLTFAIVSTAVHLFYNLTQECHKAAHRIGRYSAVHSTQLVLSFSAGILLVMFTPLREAGPFVGMIIGGLITVIVELPWLIIRMMGGRFKPALIREYFLYGTPICFSLILAYALENGDLYFIRFYLNDAAVGAYSAGYNLASRSFDFIFVWLAMAAMPLAISTLERSGEDETRRVLSDYGDLLIMIALPAAIGIALVSKEAVIVLGEPVRNDALIVMPWIAFAALLNGFINYYVHQAFVLAKKLQLLAAIMVLPVLINFGLNIVFIPQYGLVGALIATLCAYSVAIIVTVIAARRVFPLPLPVMTFAKCGLGCLIMAAGLYAIPFNEMWPDLITLFLKAISGGVIYVAAIYALDTAGIRKIIKSRSLKA